MTEIEAKRKLIEGASCRACLFYQALPGSGSSADGSISAEGLCRRRAPHLVHWDEQPLSGHSIPLALWPKVHGDDWCGEFIRDTADSRSANEEEAS